MSEATISILKITDKTYNDGDLIWEVKGTEEIPIEFGEYLYKKGHRHILHMKYALDVDLWDKDEVYMIYYSDFVEDIKDFVNREYKQFKNNSNNG